MIIKKNSFFSLVLAISMVLTFGTFKFLPLGLLALNGWVVVCFLYLVFVYLLLLVKAKFVLSAFELYVLSIIIVVPILSAFSASREFGQPIVFGLLTRRAVMLNAVSLAIIWAYKSGFITLESIKNTLIGLAWFTLVIFFLISVLLDPADFVELGAGAIGGGKVSDYSFHFRSDFLVFGLLFYAFLGFRTRRTWHWLMCLPFLIFIIVGIGGRSLILSVIVAQLFFFFRWSSFARLLTFLPKISLVSVLLAAAIFISIPEMMSSLGGKFTEAFGVIITGEKGSDASANARISETLVAVPYIQKNFLLGNGDVSNQWGGGYEGVLGAYFYPSDIGIIGVLFIYGAIGFALFAVQFIFAVQFSARISSYGFHSPLGDACKGYLLYVAIHSLVTGKFAHYSYVSLVFVAILICITLHFRDVSRKEANSSNVDGFK
jgi:hypothetical protein